MATKNPFPAGIPDVVQEGFDHMKLEIKPNSPHLKSLCLVSDLPQDLENKSGDYFI